MPTNIQSRSLEPLDIDALQRLAVLAFDDLDGLYDRRPVTKSLYHDRLLALCLCQGAAEHFVRPGHGIKDFDIWAFFRAHPKRPFPFRRIGNMDFGPSKFGRHPDDKGYKGRRVDVIGRSIETKADENSVQAVLNWVHGSSKSSRLIALRPLILVYPAASIGRVIWDPNKTLI